MNLGRSRLAAPFMMAERNSREIVETSSSLGVIVSEIEIQKHEDNVLRVNAEGPIRLAQTATLTARRKPVETFVPFKPESPILAGLVRWRAHCARVLPASNRYRGSIRFASVVQRPTVYRAG